MAKRTSSRRQLSFSGGDKDSICQLCQCYSSQLSSQCAWRSDQACSYVLSLQVPSACLICRPCRDDVTRVLANLCHVPRCRKGKTCTKSSNCCVPAIGTSKSGFQVRILKPASSSGPGERLWQSLLILLYV